MKKLSKAQKTFIIGTVAALGYSMIKGNGVYNKPRFFYQYRAIKKYIDATHPKAVIGDVVKTSQGWAVIVNDHGNCFLLNVTKTDDDVYLFSEEKM